MNLSLEAPVWRRHAVEYCVRVHDVNSQRTSHNCWNSWNQWESLFLLNILVLCIGSTLLQFLVVKPCNVVVTGPQSMVSCCSSTQADPKSSCTSTAPADSVCVAAVAHRNHGSHCPVPSQTAHVFPKCPLGQTAHAFSSGWTVPWGTVAGVPRKACFCCPCRKFGTNTDRNLVFNKQDFSIWKPAVKKTSMHLVSALWGVLYPGCK